MRLLEERLAHGGHRFLVFTHFLGDANQHAELGRQVNVLTLLLDFEEWLVERHDLLVILLTEVLHHGDGLALFALLEAARLRAHVPAHRGHLVRLVVAVAGHHDRMFELVVHGFVNFVLFRGLAREPLLFVCEPVHLLVDQFQAVVDGEVLGYVIDDQVDAPLEDPGRGEEARPSLNSIVEDLGLGGHEEARVASDLAEFRIAHLRLDDRIDETQSKRMFFHFHSVQVVKREFAHALNADDEFAAEVRLLRLEVDLLVHQGGRENVVAHADVVHEDRFKFGLLSAQNFIFLERFQIFDSKVPNQDSLAIWLLGARLFLGFFVSDLHGSHLLGDALSSGLLLSLSVRGGGGLGGYRLFRLLLLGCALAVDEIN